MKRIITVRCSLQNGSMDQTMEVSSIEEFLAKADELVDGMRMESPRGPGTLTVIRAPDSFFPITISENAPLSKTILYWERHVLGLFFGEASKTLGASNEWPDEVEDGSPGPDPDQVGW
jgi:hypothetical protein